MELMHDFGFGIIPRPMAALLAAVLCAPGMFQRSLKKVSVYSKLCLMAAVVFSLVLASLVFVPTEMDALASQKVLWVKPAENILAAWPIFGYLFAVQPGGVMVFSKLEARPSRPGLGRQGGSQQEEGEGAASTLQEARRHVSGVAYGIALTIATVIGLAACKRFGETTQGNILVNCHESRALFWGGAITALQLSSAVMLLGSAAFMMVPFRFAFFEVLKLTGARSQASEEVPASLQQQVTLGVLCLMVLVATLCDNISTVYRVGGTFATQVFAFILPGAFALKLSSRSEARGQTLGLLAVTAFGVFALLFCVMDLFSDATSRF
ncbi:unnamed protein product [Polarella glacialis]|uniref:Amino acid transporter transmembrane domain-containing protein n=1 Tax=Polarella glacialis TaxID=89957 RepID=A0A813JRF9_POLGL|nr:unnamed protein product [Polarella glacialis]